MAFLPGPASPELGIYVTLHQNVPLRGRISHLEDGDAARAAPAALRVSSGSYCEKPWLGREKPKRGGEGLLLPSEEKEEEKRKNIVICVFINRQFFTQCSAIALEMEMLG